MVKLSELAFLFFRLGSLGFGGPMALVALMEQECVKQKKWISRDRFEESFVFCKLLPGPIAYQMALWVGYELRGRIGGFISGFFFVLPAATLLYLFAKFYDSIHGFSSSGWILEGLRVGALVVILQSIGSLFSPYKKRVSAWFYALGGAFLMGLQPRLEPLIILGGGLLSILLIRSRPSLRLKMPSWTVLLALFWTHFKAGAFVFGTGLAIVPVLEKEVVGVFHWLNPQEFLDALVFGQVTPGPVTTLASFIGYKVSGGLGSIIATSGIYFPGALMILFILPTLRKAIEGKSWLTDFQLGAVPTVIGCLITASFGLLSSALVNPILKTSFLILLLVQVVLQLPAWVVILLGSVMQPILKPVFAAVL